MVVAKVDPILIFSAPPYPLLEYAAQYSWALHQLFVSTPESSTNIEIHPNYILRMANVWNRFSPNCQIARILQTHNTTRPLR